MQRHHTGSGRRPVIPADWSQHHRGVLDSTRGATVELRGPGGPQGDFDRETGTWDGIPFPAYYTGPARVQVLPAGGEQNDAAGEQDISTLRYAVMLDDAVTGIQLDDVLTVTAVDDNGDPWMVGRELIVIRIEGGSMHWERRLLARDNIETPEV